MSRDRSKSVFTNDFLIPPTESEVDFKVEQLFYSSDQYIDQVGLDPVIANHLDGIHLWGEKRMIEVMTDSGISADVVLDTLKHIRLYRIDKGYTLTLTRDSLVKALGDKDAHIFNNIDLADLSMVLFILEKRWTDSQSFVEEKSKAIRNLVHVQRQVENFITQVLGTPYIYYRYSKPSR